MSKVIVYILETDKKEKSCFLKNFFEESSLFKVIIVPYKKLKGETEECAIYKILNKSYQKYKNNYCILVKNTSVTNSSIDIVDNIVSKAISLNETPTNKSSIWNLCYLCKWLDRCDLYVPQGKIDGIVKIVKTMSPFGLQTIMFSPTGRDMIIGKTKMLNDMYFMVDNDTVENLDTQLNLDIGEENINATCIIPNLFEYNVLLAEGDGVLKLSECRIEIETNSDDESETDTFIPLFWFIAIAVLIILCAWFIYQIVGVEEEPSGSEISRPRKTGG